MTRSRDPMTWPPDAGEQHQRQDRSVRVLARHGERYRRAIDGGAVEVEVHRLRAEALVRSGVADRWLAGSTYDASAARALRLTHQLLLLPFVAAALAHHPGLGALALVLAPMMYWFGRRSHMPGFSMAGRFGREVPAPPGKWSKDYSITFAVGSLLCAAAGPDLRLVAVWFAIGAAYLGVEYARFTAAETAVRRLLNQDPATVRFLIQQDVLLLRDEDPPAPAV